MRHSQIAIAVLVASCGLAIPGPCAHAGPSPRIDPVTAGVASGVAVELLKGIAGALAGDRRAQVRAIAKTDGPDGDDFAARESYDFDDLWLEYYLDADTGIIKSEQVPNHTAWSELHFYYDDGAWRPNTSDYNSKPGVGGFVNQFAWARPDSTPNIRDDNTTYAASVAAFGLNGQIEKEYKVFDGTIAAKGGSFVDADITSEAFGSIYFTPESFVFTESGGTVTVTPAVGESRFNLVHSTAATSAGGDSQPTAILSSPYQGIAGTTGAELLSDTLSVFSDNALGNAALNPSPGAHAEITIAGVSVSLGTGEYDAIDPGTGLPKTEMQILREYLSDLAAVELLAPLQGQEGYVPDITLRQIVEGDSSIDEGAIPGGLGALAPSAQFGGLDANGEPISGVTDLIGLIVGIQGNLLSSLNLSAETEGTAMQGYFDSLNEGDEFSLQIAFNSTSMALTDSWETAIIPAPAGVALLGLAAIGLRLRR